MSEATRYTGDIVDSHHHIWRAGDLPRLSGPMVPRIFGPYEPIRRDYLIDEYVADATASGISASVYVQTNWPLDRVVDEVRWLRECRQETGWPMAVIASADMFDEDAPEIMRRQAALTPLIRGIRQQLHWHERPEFRFATAPDRMKDPVFRKNIGALADLGWLFELQVFPEQMPDAVELAAAFPGVTFVLVHAGMLIGHECSHGSTRPAHRRHPSILPAVALASGVSGGIIPCPEALSVILVSARATLDRFRCPGHSPLIAWLPVLSAAVVTVLGLVMTINGVTGLTV